jgi:hypothetical protein
VACRSREAQAPAPADDRRWQAGWRVRNQDDREFVAAFLQGLQHVQALWFRVSCGPMTFAPLPVARQVQRLVEVTNLIQRMTGNHLPGPRSSSRDGELQLVGREQRSTVASLNRAGAPQREVKCRRPTPTGPWTSNACGVCPQGVSKVVPSSHGIILLFTRLSNLF